MLSKLPLDVNIKIASLLCFEDKIRLMQTCTKFNNLIQATCLYETVSLTSSKEKVEKQILTFRKEQHMGRQTKYLTIDLDMLSNQIYGQLPSIFPNIVQFEYDDEEQEIREDIILNKFIKWKDTLKFISDSHFHLHTFCLLEKNVYSNLFELDISTSNFDGIMKHNSHINILKCIQNAPLLGILSVSECKITLAFLESVHHACRKMLDFSISSSLISTIDEVLPEPIIPADHMVEFHVSHTLILDGNGMFLRYLAQKYTELRELKIYPSKVCPSSYSYFTIEQGTEQGQLGPNLPRDHNATQEIYQKEGIPILSTIPKTIKSLGLDSRYFNDIAGILSKGYDRLTTLSVFDNHEKSVLFNDPNQLSLLHDLPALKSLTFAFNCILQEYGYNTASNTVTNINVAIKGTSLLDELDICWILSVLPSLQKICIEYSNARLVCYQDQVTDVFPRLLNVDFGVSVVHPEVFTTLYKIAPNIKEIGLTIYGTALKGDMQRKFAPSTLTLPVTPSTSQPDSDQQLYKIDLNNWDLDVFSLDANITQGVSDSEEVIILVINSMSFIITHYSTRFSAMRYSLTGKYENLDQIIIDAPRTKEIRVNGDIAIDPKLGSIRFY